MPTTRSMTRRAAKQTKHNPQEIGLREASDIINALKNTMANSQIKIPDLETPYSTAPNSARTSPTTIHDQKNIGAIINQRKQQLQAVSHEVSSAETLIEEMNGFYKQVVEKKTKIIYSLAVHKGCSSTIWCLPNEILAQIFIHCLPVEFSWMSPLNVESPPMLLTQVCRRWREVGVNLPSLWCRLCVESEEEAISYHYETWLQRTRGCPLSLFVRGHISTLSNLQHPLRPYLKHVVSLRADDCRTITPLVEDLSSIQELVISGGYEKFDLGTLGQSTLRYISSTLRSLKFTRDTSMTHEKLLPLHPLLAHLTNFEINARELTFGPLFKFCCNLSSLTIKIAPNYPHPRLGGAHTHAKLRSLCIVHLGDYSSKPPFSVLFDALKLPSLCVLEVSRKCPTFQYDNNWPHEEFKAFLKRSKCPLRRLECSGLGVTDKHVAEYRALAPSLLEVSNRSETLSGRSVAYPRRGILMCR